MASPNYSKYAFYATFYPGSVSRDRVSGQQMQTVLSPGRTLAVNGVNTTFGENEPTINENGLFTCGPYTNLLYWSEDMTQADWSDEGSPVVTATTFKATAQYNAQKQPITTVDSALYTISFTAYVNPGDRQTGFRFRHYDSETGNNTVIDNITEIPTVYSVTVLGKSGGGLITCGIFDNNTSDWVTVNITDFQVTETPYALPYIKSTDIQGVYTPNYADTDEGSKFQIMPDEPGSLYTGGTIGDDLATALTFGSHWVDNGDGSYSYTGDGTWNYIEFTGLTEGKTYKISFNVDSISDKLKLFPSPSEYVGDNPASIDHTGSYSIQFKQLLTYDFLRIGRSVTDMVVSATISNISLHEVAQNPGMPLLRAALDGAADGDELVVNGDCVEAQTVNNEGADGGFTSIPGVVAGHYYELRCPVVNCSVDGIGIKLGGTLTSPTTTKIGSFEIVYRILATATDNAQIRYNADTVVESVGPLSVKEISPAQGEMVVEWMPWFDYDEISLQRCLFDITSNTDGFLRYNLSGRLVIDDDTTVLGTDAIEWDKNTTFIVKVIFGTHPTEGVNKMQISATTGITTKSSVVDDFDGSFDPEIFLALGENSIYPQSIKSIKVYKEPQSW